MDRTTKLKTAKAKKDKKDKKSKKKNRDGSQSLPPGTNATARTSSSAPDVDDVVESAAHEVFDSKPATRHCGPALRRVRVTGPPGLPAQTLQLFPLELALPQTLLLNAAAKKFAKDVTLGSAESLAAELSAPAVAGSGTTTTNSTHDAQSDFAPLFAYFREIAPHVATPELATLWQQLGAMFSQKLQIKKNAALEAVKIGTFYTTSARELFEYRAECYRWVLSKDGEMGVGEQERVLLSKAGEMGVGEQERVLRTGVVDGGKAEVFGLDVLDSEGLPAAERSCTAETGGSSSSEEGGAPPPEEEEILSDDMEQDDGEEILSEDMEDDEIPSENNNSRGEKNSFLLRDSELIKQYSLRDLFLTKHKEVCSIFDPFDEEAELDKQFAVENDDVSGVVGAGGDAVGDAGGTIRFSVFSGRNDDTAEQSEAALDAAAATAAALAQRMAALPQIELQIATELQKHVAGVDGDKVAALLEEQLAVFEKATVEETGRNGAAAASSGSSNSAAGSSTATATEENQKHLLRILFDIAKPLYGKMKHRRFNKVLNTVAQKTKPTSAETQAIAAEVQLLETAARGIFGDADMQEFFTSQSTSSGGKGPSGVKRGLLKHKLSAKTQLSGDCCMGIIDAALGCGLLVLQKRLLSRKSQKKISGYSSEEYWEKNRDALEAAAAQKLGRKKERKKKRAAAGKKGKKGGKNKVIKIFAA